MPNATLDPDGMRLLCYLVERLEKWTSSKQDPPFVYYGDTVADLELTEEAFTPGQSLQRQGLNNLNEFTQSHGLPAICGLIVNRKSGYPSGGYFKSWSYVSPEGAGTLNGKQRNSQRWWQAELEKARTFDWRALVQDVDRATFLRTKARITDCPLSDEDSRRKYGSGGEGDAHRSLKHYVATHPEVLQLGDSVEVVIEHRFPSGNRVDVLVRLSDGRDAVVEIETTNPLPGCHQAIMYRTLRCVELAKTLQDTSVVPVLVAYDLDLATKQVAMQYGVHLVQSKV